MAHEDVGNHAGNHVDVVEGRNEETLGTVATIICAEPASAMLHGDEGIRRAFAARLRQRGHREGGKDIAKRRCEGPKQHHHSQLSFDFMT